MTKAAYIPLLAALALGAACDVDINPDENAGATTNGAAEAQDGRVSIKAPGVDISVAMQEYIIVNAESDSDLLYPGSTLSGVNIDGSGDGAVAIRFTNAEAVEKVTAWYRDAARTGFEAGAAGQSRVRGPGLAPDGVA